MKYHIGRQIKEIPQIIYFCYNINNGLYLIYELFDYVKYIIYINGV